VGRLDVRLGGLLLVRLGGWLLVRGGGGEDEDDGGQVALKRLFSERLVRRVAVDVRTNDEGGRLS
jgi:hypothetical protein